MKNQFTVGSDTEFFIYHVGTGFIPATSFNTPGTKLEPMRVHHGTFHRDNISVELQPPQGATPEEFGRNAQRLYDEMQAIYSNRSLYLKAEPTVQFTKAMLSCTEANEMGCERDKCAYTGEEQPGPTPKAFGNWRAAGGHIHIGYDGFTEDEFREVIKLLDLLEAQGLVEYEAQLSRSAWRRRQWYGQAGRYRMKPYGIEWRTPSNLQWQYYMQTPDVLFCSIDIAISLVKQGVTLNTLGSPAQIKRMRKGIDEPSAFSSASRSRHRSMWIAKLREVHGPLLNLHAEEYHGYTPNLLAS